MASTRGQQVSPDLIGDLLLVILVLVPPVEERDHHQHGADDDGQDAGGHRASDQTHTLRLSCKTTTQQHNNTTHINDQCGSLGVVVCVVCVVVCSCVVV